MSVSFREQITSDIQDRLFLSRRVQCGLFAAGIVLGAGVGFSTEAAGLSIAASAASAGVLAWGVGSERKRAVATCNRFLFQYHREATNGIPDQFVPKQVTPESGIGGTCVSAIGVMAGYLGQVMVERAIEQGPDILGSPIYKGIGGGVLVAAVAGVGYVRADVKDIAATFTAQLNAIDGSPQGS